MELETLVTGSTITLRAVDVTPAEAAEYVLALAGAAPRVEVNGHRPELPAELGVAHLVAEPVELPELPPAPKEKAKKPSTLISFKCRGVVVLFLREHGFEPESFGPFEETPRGRGTAVEWALDSEGAVDLFEALGDALGRTGWPHSKKSGVYESRTELRKTLDQHFGVQV